MIEEPLMRLGTAAAGVAAICAVAALVFDMVLREQWRIRSRLRDEFRESRGNRTQRASLFRGIEEMTLGASKQERLDVLSRVELLIEQSGVKVTPTRLALQSAVCAAVGATLGLAFAPHLALAGITTAVGAGLPLLWLLFLRQRRFSQLRRQLPEAFDLMVRAVRSGQSLPGAMRLVAQECAQPMAHEFAHCCDQQHLGLPHDVTLRDMARRNDIMEFRIFVVGMLVQRQSGGNPIELLEHLAARIRKRTRLRDRVRALTSEGRMQAWVLGVLPLGAFAAISVLDASYAGVLWQHPRLLGGLLVAQAVGAVWIRRIVNFEY